MALRRNAAAERSRDSKRERPDHEVFNGDMGRIGKIDVEEQEVTVQFGDRGVVSDWADLNGLGLARAVTIHKSQASEYSAVILPLYMQHYLMLLHSFGV
jgi:exodeoxyribonuclease V alpha subunit